MSKEDNTDVLVRGRTQGLSVDTLLDSVDTLLDPLEALVSSQRGRTGLGGREKDWREAGRVVDEREGRTLC